VLPVGAASSITLWMSRCESRLCFLSNVIEVVNFLFEVFAILMRILDARIPDNWEFTMMEILEVGARFPFMLCKYLCTLKS
jgi:hypothetical protein